MRLVEVEPGRWRIERADVIPKRSALATPYVISDEMPETEQVDGRFYTSKAKFRAVGRSLGLTEVGNEKLKPKQRFDPKRERRKAIERAITEFKQGRRPRERERIRDGGETY
jgi:hypothetical protein